MEPTLADALIVVLVTRLELVGGATPMVDWATAALAQGVESPALIDLAGLPRAASFFEADPVFQRAIRELGLEPLPSEDEIRRGYVAAVSRALLRGEVDVETALARVHRFVVGPLGHPDDLMEWCYAWDGWSETQHQYLEADVVHADAMRLARVWAGRAGWPGEIAPGGA